MSAVRTYENSERPDGWRKVRLGEVVEINQRNWDPRDGAPILYLDLTAVIAPGRLDEPKELAASDAPSRARRRVLSGDILVSTVRPNLRGFARVQKAAGNLVASTGFAVLTPSTEVEGSFVYHHVMTEQFAARLEAAATGQAYPAVRPDDVSNYSIALPPQSEQRAIANVLDSIDEAIERTEAIIAATETLRDSLLHELLTRGVPGWHAEWKDVPGIGTIPADWEVVRLGDVAEVIMGQSPTGEHCNRNGQGVPLLNGPTEYGLEHPEPVQWTTDPKKMSREGDVLFCVRGATTGRMNWADRDYAIGRGIAAIRHQAGPRNQRFVRAIIDFRLPEFYSVFTGSTFPNLSYDDITRLRVPSIPMTEQQAIADALKCLDDQLQQTGDEREAFRVSKLALADALLSGRIRTSNVAAVDSGLKSGTKEDRIATGQKA